MHARAEHDAVRAWSNSYTAARTGGRPARMPIQICLFQARPPPWPDLRCADSDTRVAGAKSYIKAEGVEKAPREVELGTASGLPPARPIRIVAPELSTACSNSMMEAIDCVSEKDDARL
ncbi:hypothetical protein EVG20_g7402 [Dentipellis fragilis]|uniref:Uncharacterized protein n=1 Tax=Dentipellis fragilis TaxID=205917 RepID=A0A4Y9YGB1_9AGAM|nr:hypothetical protein EVG20_g7402 [Dentipellis fragilis]